ncbi:unnamed protein product [Didymodactylos carnosus]|uniref:NHL repeat-containing protein n=1 Tax=Didymodactylos carnosus TaxID=1234261 RepID=A0A814VTP0_9BILA|nr:unnamed protein product [Didymodactylos carnosus]CAF3957101.1 unnamed protein product [Didymodactylos carnosus]
MKWKANGKNIGELVIGEQESDGLDQLKFPTDVLIDEQSGDMFVADCGNNRILHFSAGCREGRMIGGGGRLNRPWSLALDIEGNLYVTEIGGDRVLMFSRL